MGPGRPSPNTTPPASVPRSPGDGSPRSPRMDRPVARCPFSGRVWGTRPDVFGGVSVVRTREDTVSNSRTQDHPPPPSSSFTDTRNDSREYTGSVSSSYSSRDVLRTTGANSRSSTQVVTTTGQWTSGPRVGSENGWTRCLCRDTGGGGERAIHVEVGLGVSNQFRWGS